MDVWMGAMLELIGVTFLLLDLDRLPGRLAGLVLGVPRPGDRDLPGALGQLRHRDGDRAVLERARDGLRGLALGELDRDLAAGLDLALGGADRHRVLAALLARRRLRERAGDLAHLG